MHRRFGQAWIGALAYTFQLYFDFSGYSDMAIGNLADVRRFPAAQFQTPPTRPTSIIDFWRRWHMTLVAVSWRDYLYIPLGGKPGTGRTLRYGQP